MKPHIISIGQRFGSLVVVARAAPSNGQRVECKCDCGTVKILAAGNLIKGQRQCRACYVPGKRNIRHGRFGTRIYRIWTQMKTRCGNHRHVHYADYGGRGIRVCDAWQNFEGFYSDMGEPPSADHTLDRIDNDRGYEPGNCRWATKSEQAFNRRQRKPLTACRRGHPFSPETVMINSRGNRQCRICFNDAARRCRASSG